MEYSYLLNQINLISRVALMENAKETQRFLQDITTILKYSELDCEQVMFQEEMAHIDKFLNLHKLKKGKRLQYDKCIDSDEVIYIKANTLLSLIEFLIEYPKKYEPYREILSISTEHHDKNYEIEIVYQEVIQFNEDREKFNTKLKALIAEINDTISNYGELSFYLLQDSYHIKYTVSGQK